MQFVTGGPDVPERLIQAHEEGRVVFFCGAGISYPAELPGFRGLVNSLYKEIGEIPNSLEDAAIKAEQFDRAIGLLEARIAHGGRGREDIRRAVAKILTPPDLAARDTSTHSALLKLSRTRDEHTRLVTTNFDRLFEEVISRDSVQVDRFNAPLLPVPKSRWNGIVALHGLLAENPSGSDLDRLVLSSGDFGLAYLTERWAARFVSELFRNYTVCFVGYSINDPVLRYMMDALAADSLLGEKPSEMFAFGGYKKGQELVQESEWRAKNVTPILYWEHKKHFLLHRTICAWAETYSDGVGGKEQIVVQYANSQPQHSTFEENFVGRILWALSDSSGIPAKRFAETVPVPPFDWVQYFSEYRFRHEDLIRFGVPPLTLKEEKRQLARTQTNNLEFSLLDRPAPYLRAPYMSIVGGEFTNGSLDYVMVELADWLLRFLDEPRLLHWLANRGAQLHPYFAGLLERRLDEIGQYENSGDLSKIQEITNTSPKGVPRKILRPVWRLMIAGKISNSPSRFDLYQWFDRLKHEEFSLSMRMVLRTLLTPKIKLREPFKWDETGVSADPDTLKTFVDWELVLTCNHVHSAIRENTSPEWKASLYLFLDEAISLLRDAMDLLAELGDASAESDRSYIYQPSISEHSQNRDFQDWTALIELTRDAWLSEAAINPERAQLVAVRLWNMRYPLFRRLAFFAASHATIVSNELCLDWLLADDGWWLWSVETEREVLRLLVNLPKRLNRMQIAKIESKILVGPPRSMFRESLDDEGFQRVLDREVWLRLEKIRTSGIRLGRKAQSRLVSLRIQYPEWQLSKDGRDEFPFWLGEVSERPVFESTPISKRELLEWLRQHPTEDHWRGDDWSDRCSKHFLITAWALRKLALEEAFWPEARWRRALQAWDEVKQKEQAWRFMANVLAQAPIQTIAALTNALGWWLEKQAKTFIGDESKFFELCRRVLAIDYPDDDESSDPVSRAINHPIGHVTQALLDWWYRRELQNDQGLPDELRAVFTEICNVDVRKFRYGRVLLAANSINLFLVDRIWTEEFLLPNFDWQKSSQEASAHWEGLLWSPRLVVPFVVALKKDMLSTAVYFSNLGSHSDQFVLYLTNAALDLSDTFTLEELRSAFRSLPKNALVTAASAVAKRLEVAGEQREMYWENRVSPFLRSVWPKSALVQVDIADDFFRICLAAGKKFPDALRVNRGRLTPSPHPDYLVNLLAKSDLCKLFPKDVLEWLSLLIVDVQPWVPSKLRDCLNQLGETMPEIKEDSRYRRLDEYLRRFGK